MKKKIKLRDLTPEQWDIINKNECFEIVECKNCLFDHVYCGDSDDADAWINHKDLYSNKFLDQEVEIEVPDILTKEEREYLSDVIKSFRDKVCFLVKLFDEKVNDYCIMIYVNSAVIGGVIFLLSRNDIYTGMKLNINYTLEDLGL